MAEGLVSNSILAFFEASLAFIAASALLLLFLDLGGIVASWEK